MKCGDCGQFFSEYEEGHFCDWCAKPVCDDCWAEHIAMDDLMLEREQDREADDQNED